MLANVKLLLDIDPRVYHLLIIFLKLILLLLPSLRDQALLLLSRPRYARSPSLM